MVNGLKFDIRFYVIITGIKEGQVSAFLANEAIVRFCTVAYEPAEPSNFKNVFMHLCNYSINKRSKNYIDDLDVVDVLKPNYATKRTLSALFAEIERK